MRLLFAKGKYISGVRWHCWHGPAQWTLWTGGTGYDRTGLYEWVALFGILEFRWRARW